MRNSIKPLLGLLFAGLGSVLVFGFRTTDSVLPTTAHAPTTTKVPTTTKAPTTTTGSNASARAGATATPAPTQAASGTSTGYADGTFQGAAIREPWGTFEVEAIIKGGELVDVQLLSEPSDRHSTQINNIAVPMLTESALASQSANVDAVSGATWTSESYAESLQAALDAAHAAASVVQAAG